MSETRMNEVIHNEFISVNFTQAGEASFRVNCPFIPDEVKVRVAIGGVFNSNIQPSYEVDPIYSGVMLANNNFYANNIFSVESNMFPGSVLCFCNLTNTFNPQLRFDNKQRAQFRGNYNVNVYNSSTVLPITNGSILLHFEYIRYV